MGGDIIEVENLTHAFDGFQAVKGISFSVREGEIFSFLGPNGAGKSTTINVLITLLPLQSGRVRIAGYDVAREPARVRESIGVVFQNEVLDRDLTVRETMEFHGRLYGIPRDERRAKIEEMLGIVKLTGKRDERTKNLSGGMKRRLEIARGLMTQPQVLFLDEPTIGLDPQTRLKMWDYIEQVNEAGTTIFLTTHYMDEADTLSDRISIIDHGEIVTTGTPDSLKNALGEDVIYLETTDNRAAEKALGSLKSVRNTMASPRGLVVTITEDGSRCLPAVIDRVRGEGIAIRSVNLKKPSMDDVFVHYTGRELRDTGEAGRGGS
ncbi:ATP-binding cassette domain-containing protein [Methanoculleus sp. FWC-SCC1]|uniref:ATP-binding cassette domain-containing protein n=1 Tax=Methanoculleus frigidifontis TaxID=2584085 RepID=A0ABT8M9W0_9EURY|nr:ATP-binding cassette domain-containing protein [Methanoculleus sp. FWC-SCC1]MDN7024726.1 ATP-binding cassette domain-containing protein [Methanoculleus sp. FWC-SCC1]